MTFLFCYNFDIDNKFILSLKFLKIYGKVYIFFFLMASKRLINLKYYYIDLENSFQFPLVFKSYNNYVIEKIYVPAENFKKIIKICRQSESPTSQ